MNTSQQTGTPEVGPEVSGAGTLTATVPTAVIAFDFDPQCELLGPGTATAEDLQEFHGFVGVTRQTHFTSSG